jgi:hypothetical protein
MIRDAQNRNTEAEAALRKAVEAVVSTEYMMLTVPAAVDLALVLARHGRTSEAAEISDRYRSVVRRLQWHEWDQQFARVEALIGSDIRH